MMQDWDSLVSDAEQLLPAVARAALPQNVQQLERVAGGLARANVECAIGLFRPCIHLPHSPKHHLERCVAFIYYYYYYF